ncbi:MAG: radical SAM protein [Gemmatimonadetes bacterium]|nr:radical SAM protein [Gemmatimonadota bacterium]MDA1103896.1 radical SAM protein [Gemmatimonadota bacterium]
MTEPFLRITEIFHSIQGESTWAGLPCTFVRLTGCPLRCTWCDTAYAFQGGKRMTFDEILAEVQRHPTQLVEITGGEPLAHAGAFDLADRLLGEGYTVLVETSGAFDVGPLDPRVHKIMDLKCPGSGESARNLWTNLEHLTERDEVKFVVKDREDYEWAREAIQTRGLDDRVRSGSLRALLISPVWGEVDLEALAAWILADGLPVRFQIQVHKLIWGAEATGV